MPKSAPEWTMMTTEAWCYGHNDEEVAYVRITRLYETPKIPSVLARAPDPGYTYEPDGFLCAKPTEQRGPLICLTSDLF